MRIRVSDTADLPRAAAEFAAALGNRRVVSFKAPMGAGKTTFISALCAHLGADPLEVNSPTFAIVNDYETPEGSIYHFDLYRLEDAQAVLDIGFEDYLDSGQLCLIEWPEVAEPFLPEDTVEVSIEVEPETGARIIDLVP